MTHVVADRIQESSTTVGLGAIALAGAITGYRTFASVMTSPSDTAYVAIVGVDANGVPTGEWETSRSTYSSANTLTRTTVLASSNAGAAVNFSSGNKRVFIDVVASSVVLTQFAQTWNAAQTFVGPGGAMSAVASLVTINSNDAIAADAGASLGFGGNYTGTTKTNWAGIAGLKDNSTDGEYGGYLALYYRTNGFGLVEGLRLLSNGNISILTGDLKINTVGKGIYIAEGSNATMGVATLVAGTVTVSTTKVTANSRIFYAGQNSSGTHGEVTVSTRTAGTSFTLTSLNVLDTRDMAWWIAEPA